MYKYKIAILAFITISFFGCHSYVPTTPKYWNVHDSELLSEELKCDDMRVEVSILQMFTTVSESYTVFWNDTFIYDTAVAHGYKGRKISFGVLNKGEWTIIKVLTEEDQRLVNSLIEDAVTDAGGERGLIAYKTCRTRMEAKMAQVADIVDSYHE